jgi:hypothetical protein
MSQARIVGWVALLLFATDTLADEGGASFWLPGQMSSFAAAPGDPGFSLPVVYYHQSSSAGGAHDFVIGGRLVAGIDANVDLVFFAPTYVASGPVMGGQASVGMGWAAGRMRVGVDATLTGPSGNVTGTGRSDTVTGGSDLYPTASIKWNNGNNNTMVYAMAGVPTGAYQLGRLANIGLNHWSLDGGGGYTYLDAKKGHEFTVVGGLTYNFENNDTHYQNGVDAHVDWALSQFLNEQWHVGVVGYIYQQLTGDRGSGAKLGSFEARVLSAGPEAGYFFPFNGSKGYVSLRGYWEFAAQHRPEGWNAWITFALPIGGESK